MSFDADVLYRLIPVIHRIRDAEIAKASKHERGPLEELIAIFSEQIAVVEENLEQLYDDLFIETCADWVVPYIGDLIGYEPLHGDVPEVASPRAEVAHTIALRRRKGTALVLEQVARDVTGWNARAVEFFQLLSATQYMNHPRPHSRRCPNLRDSEALGWIGTAFETTSRSVDVRRIESGRGRHNIPNVGLFIWRINAYPHRETPAVRVAERRYRVSPLDHDMPLYSHPQPEEDITHLADPVNVPLALPRRHLARNLASYYGERANSGAETDNENPSLLLRVDGAQVERDQVVICDLSDSGPGWNHTPEAGRYAIDPVLGRIALPPDAVDPAAVLVTWHEGFSAEMGGGEYDRSPTLPDPDSSSTVVRVPDDQPTLTAALGALSGNGTIIVTDSGRYEETLSVSVAASGSIEIRAEDGRRPTIILSGPMNVSGGADSRVTLNGLQIAGGRIQVPGAASNGLASLALAHCTLVPGISLKPAGEPRRPKFPSLKIGRPEIEISLSRCIVGGIRIHSRASMEASDSIIDGCALDNVAFSDLDGSAPGGRLALQGCTVIGKIHTREFGEVSDSILLASLSSGDAWPAPVRAERKQEGCMRFSFVPFESIVPRRYNCQPDSASSARSVVPHIRSLRYGTPEYCQLAPTTPESVRRGAENESEMGAFHHLYGPMREANLLIRLKEYVRVGLRAGIFYES